MKDQARALENFRSFERWGRSILRLEISESAFPVDCHHCGLRFEEGQEVVEHYGERFCKECAPRYFRKAELAEVGL